LAEIDKSHVSPQRKSFLDKLKSFFTSEESKDVGEAKKPEA
jgi:hypothetical protein